jgi:hypothetical protein
VLVACDAFNHAFWPLAGRTLGFSDGIFTIEISAHANYRSDRKESGNAQYGT